MQTRNQVQNWQLEMYHNGEWRRGFPWKGREVEEEIWCGLTFDAACDYLGAFTRKTNQGKPIKWRLRAV